MMTSIQERDEEATVPIVGRLRKREQTRAGFVGSALNGCVTQAIVTSDRDDCFLQWHTYLAVNWF